MPYTALHHDSRHPFQWLIVGFNLSYAVFQTISGIYPGAIDNNTDVFFRSFWGGLLLFGSTICLIGMIMKNHSRGLALETWGMYVMAGSLGVYGFSILIGGKVASIYAGCILLTVTIACFWRGVQIQRALRKIGRGEFVPPGSHVVVIKKEPGE